MIDFFAKNARRFRITMGICLALTVIFASAIIVFSVKYIEDYSRTVKQAVFDANNSQAQINNISDLASRLNQQSSSVARVEQIVADSKSYQYQDVIINDLRSIASNAGVTITNFDFSGQAGASGTATSAASAAAAAAAAKAAASGLHYTTVSITIQNPVDYNSFLNFIHYIELNNTKMQISNVGLSATTDAKNPNGVDSETLQIEVYIK